MAKVVIPVGPQHPALKEPESFTLYLEGERIAASNVTLDITTGVLKKPVREEHTLKLFILSKESVVFARILIQPALLLLSKRLHSLRS